MPAPIKPTFRTCSGCGGKGYRTNPSSHEDSPCGRCQGKGREVVPPVRPEPVQAQQGPSLAVCIEALIERSSEADLAGDRHASQTLMDAVRLIRSVS